jgi:hypothetical protein
MALEAGWTAHLFPADGSAQRQLRLVGKPDLRRTFRVKYDTAILRLNNEPGGVPVTKKDFVRLYKDGILVFHGFVVAQPRSPSIDRGDGNVAEVACFAMPFLLWKKWTKAWSLTGSDLDVIKNLLLKDRIQVLPFDSATEFESLTGMVVLDGDLRLSALSGNAITTAIQTLAEILAVKLEAEENQSEFAEFSEDFLNATKINAAASTAGIWDADYAAVRLPDTNQDFAEAFANSLGIQSSENVVVQGGLLKIAGTLLNEPFTTGYSGLTAVTWATVGAARTSVLGYRVAVVDGVAYAVQDFNGYEVKVFDRVTLDWRAATSAEANNLTAGWPAPVNTALLGYGQAGPDSYAFFGQVDRGRVLVYADGDGLPRVLCGAYNFFGSNPGMVWQAYKRVGGASTWARDAAKDFSGTSSDKALKWDGSAWVNSGDGTLSLGYPFGSHGSISLMGGRQILVHYGSGPSGVPTYTTRYRVPGGTWQNLGLTGVNEGDGVVIGNVLYVEDHTHTATGGITVITGQSGNGVKLAQDSPPRQMTLTGPAKKGTAQFQLRRETAGSGGGFSLGRDVFTFRVRTDGGLDVRKPDGSSQQVAAAGAFPTATWKQVRLEWETNGDRSTWYVRVLIDAVQQGTTYGNSWTTGASDVDRFQLGVGDQSTIPDQTDIRFDELVVWGSHGAVVTLQGQAILTPRTGTYAIHRLWMEATQTTPGASAITYEASVDGGLTWRPVTRTTNPASPVYTIFPSDKTTSVLLRITLSTPLVGDQPNIDLLTIHAASGYTTPGTYESLDLDAGANVIGETITIKATSLITLPPGCTISWFVSSNGGANFTPHPGPGSTVTIPVGQRGQDIRVRAVMATTDRNVSPLISRIDLSVGTPSGVTTLTYQVSRDGGTNWHTVANNAEVDLTPFTGEVGRKTLKIRVSATTTDLNVIPFVSSIKFTARTAGLTYVKLGTEPGQAVMGEASFPVDYLYQNLGQELENLVAATGRDAWWRLDPVSAVYYFHYNTARPAAVVTGRLGVEVEDVRFERDAMKYADRITLLGGT